MKERQKLKRNIIILSLAFFTLLAALIMLPRGESAAWYSRRRSISTPSEVAMPAVLDIRGKDYSLITSISLSELDTGSGDGMAQFLFCVCGDYESNYLIEMAHTTNVPFTYKIFPAQISETAPGAEWTLYTADETDAIYYYNGTQEVFMRYLNLDSTLDPGDAVVANQGTEDYYFAKVYSAADAVHSAAMPLFKLSESRQSSVPNAEEQFKDYYVLQVSWTESLQSKEIDMVYLMAQLDHGA